MDGNQHAHNQNWAVMKTSTLAWLRRNAKQLAVKAAAVVATVLIAVSLAKASTPGIALLMADLQAAALSNLGLTAVQAPYVSELKVIWESALFLPLAGLSILVIGVCVQKLFAAGVPSSSVDGAR